MATDVDLAGGAPHLADEVEVHTCGEPDRVAEGFKVGQIGAQVIDDGHGFDTTDGLRRDQGPGTRPGGDPSRGGARRSRAAHGPDWPRSQAR